MPPAPQSSISRPTAPCRAEVCPCAGRGWRARGRGSRRRFTTSVRTTRSWPMRCWSSRPKSLVLKVASRPTGSGQSYTYPYDRSHIPLQMTRTRMVRGPAAALRRARTPRSARASRSHRRPPPPPSPRSEASRPSSRELPPARTIRCWQALSEGCSPDASNNPLLSGLTLLHTVSADTDGEQPSCVPPGTRRGSGRGRRPWRRSSRRQGC